MKWLLFLALFSMASVSFAQDADATSEETETEETRSSGQSAASCLAFDPSDTINCQAYMTNLINAAAEDLPTGGEDDARGFSAPNDCKDVRGFGDAQYFNFNDGSKKLKLQKMCENLFRVTFTAQDGENCRGEIQAYNAASEEAARNSAKSALITCINKPALWTDINNQIKRNTNVCEAFREVRKFASNDGADNDELYQSQDGFYRCIRRNSFTSDYESCKRMLITYDSAKMAETAAVMGMETQASMRAADATARFNEQAAEGNAQIAAADSIRTIATNRRNQELSKVGIFSTQATAFTTLIGTYVTPNNMPGKCENEQKCECAVDSVYEEDNSTLASQMFANQATRGMFMRAVMEATGKAVQAGILARNFKKQRDAAKEVKEQMENYVPDASNDPRFDTELCSTNPNLAGCQRSGMRVSNGDAFSFSGANTQGGGNNINLDTGSANLGDASNPNQRALSNQRIDNLNNLINKGRSEGRDNSFNAPGAAQVGDSAGGSGGGSAGGAGGGAASGGGAGPGGTAANASDAEAQDSGVSKSGLKFAGGSGAGITGSGTRNKNTDNPFAAQAKSEGRSTASVVEQESGVHRRESKLFEKISDRYGRVLEEKRLVNIVK